MEATAPRVRSTGLSLVGLRTEPGPPISTVPLAEVFGRKSSPWSKYWPNAMKAMLVPLA